MLETSRRLIDLGDVYESMIWGIVHDQHETSDISSRIIQYLHSLPVVQEYDIDEAVKKMIGASVDGDSIKLDDAIEIIRDNIKSS